MSQVTEKDTSTPKSAQKPKNVRFADVPQKGDMVASQYAEKGKIGGDADVDADVNADVNIVTGVGNLSIDSVKEKNDSDPDHSYTELYEFDEECDSECGSECGDDCDHTHSTKQEVTADEVPTDDGKEHEGGKEDDDTVAPDTSINMFDKFLHIYNAKHGTTGSMFENINTKNPSDTNDKMEMFYEFMAIHMALQRENPEYIDVYEPGVPIVGNSGNDVYALVVGKESTVKYLSLSFISLLKVGVENPQDVGKNWSIIKL
ncbi:hypothetical protein YASMINEVIRUS_803 [Yasminevirus sp. GU-2018]|uniref:Uncharacterized protein n=1 Tax=Yasminevirus sp. GU-2018 TaxID=2420051 RepID=A0A5K0U941_9VIRU|nr:hypothetical protein YASMINEVIRUS_803 [Yasminevirus sp. GU-2018]